MEGPQVTGLSLRVMRAKARVTQTELGKQIGYNQNWLSALEQRALVKPEWTERYREGIAAIEASRTVDMTDDEVLEAIRVERVFLTQTERRIKAMQS